MATPAPRDADPSSDLDTDISTLLEALFTHVPGPRHKWTAVEICARTSQSNHVSLGGSYLSQLRSGKARSPSFPCLVGIAAAFEVDPAFFTVEFHHAHRTMSMRDRVTRARLDYGHLLHTAAQIHALPDQQREVVLALLDVLVARGTTARDTTRRRAVTHPAVPGPSVGP